MAEEQLPLFDRPEGAPPEEDVPSPGLTPQAPLHTAIAAFGAHMQHVDFTLNTIKSFLGDLSLLERYLGREVEIGTIATEDLRRFMQYLQHGRGVPCTPKSYSRRLTTLKVFFGWLAEAGVLGHDPAAPLVHRPAASPLPQVLFDEQVERALEAARRLAADPKKPDPRPPFLLSLILQTGIKKSECLSLQYGDFDLSDPAAPAVWIRYKDPRRRHKERKIAVASSLPAMLRAYVEAYRPRPTLFPWTGRNLEYVLRHIAQLAGLEGGLSFETLRWTCALRDFRSGMDPDRLRRKLGVSEITWEDTLAKLQALAANPL